MIESCYTVGQDDVFSKMKAPQLRSISTKNLIALKRLGELYESNSRKDQWPWDNHVPISLKASTADAISRVVLAACCLSSKSIL